MAISSGKSSSTRPDQDIARAVVNALEWNVAVPKNRIQVKVQDGWVTLSGEVDWQFEKSVTETSVRHLIGVRGIHNEIVIKSKVKLSDVKTGISNAFQRNALLEPRLTCNYSTLATFNSPSTLRGTVSPIAGIATDSFVARNILGEFIRFIRKWGLRCCRSQRAASLRPRRSDTAQQGSRTQPQSSLRRGGIVVIKANGRAEFIYRLSLHSDLERLIGNEIEWFSNKTGTILGTVAPGDERRGWNYVILL